MKNKDFKIFVHFTESWYSNADMSRIYKKQYSGFQRHILSEFMTPKELAVLDEKYNQAKLAREEKRSKGIRVPGHLSLA